MEVLGGIPIKQQFLFFLFPQPLVTTTLLLNLTALYTSYRWKWRLLSHIRPFATAWTIQSLYSQGQNTGVGSLSLLQQIFPTQGLNRGLLHCRQILYQLSHQGRPRILEWVAYPFFRGISWPRNQTGSPALLVDSLPAQLPGKPWDHTLSVKPNFSTHSLGHYFVPYHSAVCTISPLELLVTWEPMLYDACPWCEGCFK